MAEEMHAEKNSATFSSPLKLKKKKREIKYFWPITNDVPSHHLTQHSSSFSSFCTYDQLQ